MPGRAGPWGLDAQFPAPLAGPAYGFACVRIASDGTTVTAASQLVDEIVRKGYAERQPHPGDARARLVVLTGRGRECTRAAEESAAEAVRPWVELIGEGEVRALRDHLLRIAPYGPIRPAW
ncbi:MarR family winged helix-turn-helix transcriptional regulator [Streptomyces tauricus]|uniref:MarR family winged helix-turn-helix transcriptional regulator n=1 Tax=Streptomyces tauricus TaxID=68274 RepID=UPI003820FAD9